VVVGGGAAALVLYPVVFLIQAALSVGDPQARPPDAYGLDNSHRFPATRTSSGTPSLSRWWRPRSQSSSGS
jgi:hypothetical protein